MTSPKLYLAIDNCFAGKRWTAPEEWARVVAGLGLSYVEASADTELDPLYMGAQYTAQWIDLARESCARENVTIQNVYSGHGTYATTGIAHISPLVRRRFIDDWMKKQIDTANALGAGFGFFAHGFDEMYLQSHARYEEKLQELYASLAEIAAYAKQTGMRYAGLEQMYTPHMPPWTIDGARTLLQRVYAQSGAPFYLTIDLGHMNGQQYFQRPDEERVLSLIRLARHGMPQRRVWLGTANAMAIYRAAVQGEIQQSKAVERILADIEKNPHLFASPQDGDIWAWTRALGQYSPIIHLQQSDGKSSPHWPFSSEYNEKGVVSGEKLMEALCQAYAQEAVDGLPAPCEEIVLTLEPFIATAANVYDFLDDLEQSVRYWRRFLPRDGMTLQEAAALIRTQPE